MEINSIGKPSDFWESVRNLRKSATDKKIAGVCGGFGEHTPMPSWLWRACFYFRCFSGGRASSLTSFFGSVCLLRKIRERLPAVRCELETVLAQ